MSLTPPMDPAVKQQWIDALRSGNFEQTTAVLNRDDKFCCLGVLCELAISAGVKVNKSDATCGLVNCDCSVNVYVYDGQKVYPPESVTAWAGLASANPKVPLAAGDHFGAYLSDLNDDGKDFRFIADVIEKNL